VLNSWGTDGGNGGYYWIDYDYFAKIVITHVFGDEIFLALPRFVNTGKATNVSGNSVAINGLIISTLGYSFTQKGICYNTSSGPTITNNHSQSAFGLGKFSDTLTNLSSSQKYYARAYASNGSLVLYGNEVSFTTAHAPIALTTTSAGSITQTSAVSGGNITSDGGVPITARGVCWSTSQMPTVTASKTSDGTGVGSFSSTLTGLTAGTTYFGRAYATNAAGTSYGNQISFSTGDSSMSLNNTKWVGTVTSISGYADSIDDPNATVDSSYNQQGTAQMGFAVTGDSVVGTGGTSLGQMLIFTLYGHINSSSTSITWVGSGTRTSGNGLSVQGKIWSISGNVMIGTGSSFVDDASYYPLIFYTKYTFNLTKQ